MYGENTLLPARVFEWYKKSVEGRKEGKQESRNETPSTSLFGLFVGLF